MERNSNNLSINTIVSSAVAVACVAALCITYAVSGKKPAEAAADTNVTASPAAVSAAATNDEYMTEAEAAAYIGVPADVMKLMREKLGYFKGAYMNYIYLDSEGKEVKSIVYNKEALDDAVAKLSKDVGALSFKFLQEKK